MLIIGFSNLYYIPKIENKKTLPGFKMIKQPVSMSKCQGLFIFRIQIF